MGQVVINLPQNGHLFGVNTVGNKTAGVPFTLQTEWLDANLGLVGYPVLN
jgi:hypothetical protein